MDRSFKYLDKAPAAIYRTEGELSSWVPQQEAAQNLGTSCLSLAKAMGSNSKTAQTECQHRVVAYGDWNQDGWDDVVVELAVGDRVLEFVVLSKKKPEDPLQPLSRWQIYWSNANGATEMSPPADSTPMVEFSAEKLQCSGDQIEVLRQEVLKDIGRKALVTAFEKLSPRYKSCKAKSPAVIQGGLISDLSLVAQKLDRKEFCKELKADFDRLDTFRMSEKVPRAIMFNLSKCLK